VLAPDASLDHALRPAAGPVPRSIRGRTGPRVGLVLGGGGLVGLAYHAAALTALETDVGWDGREADVVVGTSAGSIAGALLRRGFGAIDLASTAVGAEVGSASGLDELLRAGATLPPVGLRTFVRPVRVPHPSLLAGIVRRPTRVDPIGLAAGLLRDGAIGGEGHRAHLATAIGDEWPDEPTWICTVRQRDLRRVVFGRDAWGSLSDAVVASCAVPGYFTPPRIDDVTYLDGGVHSPTNAATLVDRELDLVIVVSPMSTRSPQLLGLGSWVRRYATAKLNREVAALRRHGIPTVVLQPGRALTPVLGIDFMDATHLREVVAASYFDVAEQLAARRVQELVAPLRTPSATAIGA